MELLTIGVAPEDRDVVTRLATGDVQLSSFALHPMAGRRRIACPPALTPLIKRFDDSYVGLWRHPVVPGRTYSFVEYVWETSRVREVATSASQLVSWLFVGLLEPVDDPGSHSRWAALEHAASALGITDLALFYDRTLAGFGSLYGLPAFVARPPRDADTPPLAGYRGEFPAAGDAGTAPHRTAGCEYPSGSTPIDAPWLSHGTLTTVFADLVAAGDLAGAWLTLNTPGWPVNQAEQALGRLAAVVDDDALHLLALDWTQHTDRLSGGY